MTATRRIIRSLVPVALLWLSVSRTRGEDAMENLIGRIESRSAVLAERIAACQAAELNVYLPDSALAIAELYLAFGREDLAAGKKTGRPVASLEYIVAMLDDTIAEADAALAGRVVYPAIPEWDMMNLRTRDGAILSGDEPVFLTGFNWGAGYTNADPKLMKRLGTNLIDGVLVGDLNPDGTPQDGTFRGREEPSLEMARRENFAVDCLVCFGPPKRLYEEFPDFASPGFGHYESFAVDHPAWQDYLNRLLDHFVPRYAKHPALFAIDLANEPAYQGVSAYTIADWRRRLQAKYGTVEALNDAWQTAFGSFAEIDRPVSEPEVRKDPWSRVQPDFDVPGTRAQYYDWCRFNKDRINGIFGRMNATIARHAPEVATHVKVMLHEYFTGSMESRGWGLGMTYNSYGIDLPALLNLSAHISGGDMGIADSARHEKPNAFYGVRRYSLGWLNHALVTDFITSVVPDKPYYNSEYHAMEEVDATDVADMDHDYMKAALLYSHLHGMRANLIWYWGRSPGKGPTGGDWYENSLLEQPWALHAYLRESLLLRTRVRPVMAFSQGPRPIRILYSDDSAILDTGHNDELRATYEALNFLGIPIGFVTDTDLAAGKSPAGLRALVVPHVVYASDGTVRTVERLAAEGVRVVLIGTDNLTRTTADRPRPAPELPEVSIIPRGSATDYLPEFEKLAKELAVQPDLRALGPDGQPVWGVETRTARVGDTRYAYIVNLLTEPVDVRLAWRPQDATPVDETDLRSVPIPRELTLPPRRIFFGSY